MALSLALNIAIPAILAGCIYVLVGRQRSTRLLGPLADTWMLGVTMRIMAAPDAGIVYEKWADEYGPVYEIPAPLGTKRIVLFDPAAVAHIYSQDAWKYELSALAKKQLSMLSNRHGLLIMAREEHRRHRRILHPAFSVGAVKSYVPVFLDAVYKVKAAWDDALQHSGESAVVDVGDWMSRLSFDVIGNAALSHDFGHLDGHSSELSEAFADLARFRPSKAYMLILMVAQVYPLLLKLPLLRRSAQVMRVSETMDVIGADLVRKASNEQDPEVGKSALGMLVKAKELSTEEAKGHVKSVILAGNETSAALLKWTLVELAKHLQSQEKLHAELESLGSSELTYDDLMQGLPYLDAVVRETLRLHPIIDTTRVAVEDDVVPLDQPIRTAAGTAIDRLTVPRGTAIVIPVGAINRAQSIWGPTAKNFDPERWLTVDDDGIPAQAKKFGGFHHILSFIDGAHVCLGKNFAIIEIKVVVATLMRHYRIEPRDGPETKFTTGRRITVHPKVDGEEGVGLPMRITSLKAM